MKIAQPLSDKELSGPGFYYLVNYKLLDSPGLPQTTRIDDPTRSEVAIHDREIFRKYQISVQSANQLGLSTQRVVARIGYSGEGSEYQSFSSFIQ